MLEWLDEHQWILWVLAATSLVLFVGSLFIVPAIIVRLRSDYFAHDERPPSRWADRPVPVRILVHVLKNGLGIVLFVAGIIMLGLPGQGLLTMLVGVLLMDFPGKYRFERWLVSRRMICRPINWLRRRAGRAPIHHS